MQVLLSERIPSLTQQEPQQEREQGQEPCKVSATKTPFTREWPALPGNCVGALTVLLSQDHSVTCNAPNVQCSVAVMPEPDAGYGKNHCYCLCLLLSLTLYL